MTKPLHREQPALYYMQQGLQGNIRITGPNPWLLGDYSRLRGDCTGLRGECSGLRGDCTRLRGDCSGLQGNLDDIPQAVRPCSIEDWVE